MALSTSHATISIYAPAIYRNASMREQLRERFNHQYLSIYVVEDDEDEDNVILVHYYPDEDDEIDEDDVVEIVKNVDGNAYVYYK